MFVNPDIMQSCQVQKGALDLLIALPLRCGSSNYNKIITLSKLFFV